MSKIPVVNISGSKRRLENAFDDLGNTEMSSNDISVDQSRNESKRMNTTSDQSQSENGKQRTFTKFGWFQRLIFSKIK